MRATVEANEDSGADQPGHLTFERFIRAALKQAPLKQETAGDGVGDSLGADRVALALAGPYRHLFELIGARRLLIAAHSA